jgi:hypothetical protein
MTIDIIFPNEYSMDASEWFVIGGLNVTSVVPTRRGVKISAHTYRGEDTDERDLRRSCTWYRRFMGPTFDTRTCTLSGCSSWSRNSGKILTIEQCTSGITTVTCGRSRTGSRRRLCTTLSGAGSKYVGLSRCWFGRFDYEWNLT